MSLKSFPNFARDLLKKRYGAEQSFEATVWNDALQAVLSHRTVRAYLPRPVPDDIFQLAVAAAQSAPSSSNLQAWSLVAVKDPERRAALADLAKQNPQILSAPLFLLWIADLSRLRQITVGDGKAGDGLDYLESFLLASVDASLAAQNALVALESLGLGTCYIGGMRDHPAEVAAQLNLPAEAIVLFGMTVGYPDPDIKTDVKPRLPQSAVLHLEQYGEAARDAAHSDYDDTMRLFQKNQGMAERGWTKVVAGRVGDKGALKGRDLLTGIVRQLGFKLR